MFGNTQDLTAQEKVTAEWNGMAGEWDDLAGGYSAGFYAKLMEATGLDPCSLSQGFTVVDFGCGTGLLTAKLRPVCSSVLAIDAASGMVEILQDKIRGGEWENVKAVTAVLGDLASADESARQDIEGLYETVDLVVASSVMSLIPAEDMEATMKVIGRLLKPAGQFVHSDWPKSEAKHPDAMSEEKALTMYGMGGLQAESTAIMKMDMGGGPEQPEVFFGVAKKI